MKKKIAILLAAVMAIAPVNMFAASTNTVIAVREFPAKTINLETTTSLNGYISAESSGLEDGIEEIGRGTDYTIEVKDRVLPAGSRFELLLDNAHWFFRGTSGSALQAGLVYSTNNSDLDTGISAGTAATFASGAAGFTQTTYDPTLGTYNESTNTYTRADGSYTMQFSRDGRSAIIDVPNQINIGSIMTIPLVTVTTGGEAKVTLNPMNTDLTATPAIFARERVGGTNTRIDPSVKARDEFDFNLFIQEKSAGKFKDGFFTIKAPSGFNFANSMNITANRHTGDVKFGVDANGNDVISSSVNWKFGEDGSGRVDTSIIVLEIAGLTPSTTVSELKFEGLKLIAERDAKFGEVVLTLKDGDQTNNYKNGAEIKGQDVKGLERVDWNIIFKTVTAIPTLVSGRYDVENSTNANDDTHKTAKVLFEEAAAGNWWARQETTFELNDGVKFRAVEFVTQDNLTADLVADDMVSVQLASDPESATIYQDTNVTIESNVLTIRKASIKANKMAKIEMDMWVSIEPGFEGDVVLTAKNPGFNSSVTTEVSPIVIAKAVAPITIDTKITDVRVGLQGESTADFTITETDKAMLQRGKSVTISLTDEIRDDNIVFAHKDGDPIKVEVEGDLRIKDVKTDAGKITFVIDRESTKPATIKVTNVRVKLNRDVPETNLHPYKLVVGGSAVAGNIDTVSPVKFDKFSNSYTSNNGIKADYLRVITSHTGVPGQFTTLVKVTVGSNEVIVGNNAPIKMDTAAFIDPESQSIMVPVRFVSQALGIHDDLIVWDNINRTVTIYAAKTIKFTIGSTEIVVDGVATQMYTNGYAVKALIKDDRSFLPFRWLGNALGVPVAWDAATQTAIYNPDQEIK